MTTAWNTALDTIEVNLARTEAALAAGTTPPRSAAISVPTEPLPADLGPRARALAELTERLAARADDHLQRLGRSIRGLPGRRVSPPATRIGKVIDFGA